MTFGALVNLFYSITDRALELLQGEPLRAIAYGSAVIIYVVAKLLGNIPDVSFIEAVGQATAAALVIAGIVESARKFVTPIARPTLPYNTPITTTLGIASHIEHDA